MTHPGPEEKLRVVLAGCGGMGRFYLPILLALADVEVVGLVDPDPPRAPAKADEFRIPGAVTGTCLAELLDRVPAHVLVDASPPAAHRDNALLALARGCDVLTEKPLATSVAEAADMIRAARRHGRLHAVMQNRRWDRNLRRFAALANSGSLGQPTTLHADFFTALPPVGFRAEMEHVLLEDMAIHTFDAARLLCGADAVSVDCHSWNPQGSDFRGGASAVAVFQMGNGMVFTYRGSWSAVGLPTSWQSEWRLLSTAGSATWDGEGTLRAEAFEGFRDNQPVVRAVDVPGTEEHPWPDGGHGGLLMDFLSAVRGRRTPETTSSDNFHSLAMSLAAIESARAGRRVAVAATPTGEDA